MYDSSRLPAITIACVTRAAIIEFELPRGQLPRKFFTWSLGPRSIPWTPCSRPSIPFSIQRSEATDRSSRDAENPGSFRLTFAFGPFPPSFFGSEPGTCLVPLLRHSVANGLDY